MVATDQRQSACVVDLVSGPTAPGRIDDFELEHARRVLAQLKSSLGRQGLLELLSADINVGVDFMREMVEQSKGS